MFPWQLAHWIEVQLTFQTDGILHFFSRSIDASSYSEIPTELSHACMSVCMFVYSRVPVCVCCYYDRACAVNRVSGWSFFGLALLSLCHYLLLCIPCLAQPSLRCLWMDVFAS